MKISGQILFAFLVILFAGATAAPAKVIEAGKDMRYRNFNEALEAACINDTIVLHGGVYYGNFVISKPVSLIGKNKPVFDGNNSGTVLTIKAANVRVEGIVIKNSGKLLEKEDAGILTEGDSVVIRNNYLESVLFGIYFMKADNGIIENNLVEGKKELDVPRRGDLFRAWYSKNLIIKNNRFRYGRDVIIWFSENVRISGNTMSGARYGLHFMYNKHCTITQNTMTENSVGMYLMYSQNIKVENNLAADNKGASGFGIGLKDMDNAELRDNVIADNRVGLFNDNSPRSYDAYVKFTGNVVAYNETGMQIMSSLVNSTIAGNSFIENYRQAALSRGQDADNDFWRGNYWSDYSGYDKDGDGSGDMPYRSKEMVESILEEKPNLKVFLYSPAINALNYASETFPILEPQSKLVDKHPSMKPYFPEGVPVHEIRKQAGLLSASLLLTFFPVTLLVLFFYKNSLVKKRVQLSRISGRNR